MNEKVIARFWSHVDIRCPTECWEWKRGTNKDGYGRFGSGRKNDKNAIISSRLVHRISWTLTNGQIPEGMEVLHSCDNPPCCNPGHLFLGTQLENMRDMAAKGRWKTTVPRTANVSIGGSVRLSFEDKRRLCLLVIRQGVKPREAANMFGVSLTTVYKLWHGLPRLGILPFLERFPPHIDPGPG